MIQPTDYQMKLDGKSNNHLITFNDGHDYAVKFFQPQCNKSLVNEWVGYCLGRYLGLPIPFGRIVEIPPDFSPHIPELAELNYTKYQFASRYIPNCLNGHQVLDVQQIVNESSLAGIIVFDYWVGNLDRTRKNILLREEQPNTYHLWIIDQAEIFGGFDWGIEDLENLPSNIISSTTHKFIAKHVKEEEQFFAQLELIQTLPILLMEEIVTLIPEEWNVSNEERKAIVTALIIRRNKVLPKLLEKFIKKVYRPLHGIEGSS
ncbi:HipA family kinase [Neobacillus sedimentimangrovi]|uniref:HipA family kinase n=1 Tax=Neobacillus sedimentimangrovi TaxID=2699460 RepID=UPI0013D71750|nr:HipA family kinase [Neobacillus sedimentimangrovi]